MSVAEPSSSPLDRTLSRVGDRWSLLVVAALLGGPRRFADLQDLVPGIASNVLAARLKHLEGERLARAVAYSTRPLRYAYELTEAGRDLEGAVRLLTQWGVDHGDGVGDAAPRHDECGTPLQARWWCPTCERTADSSAGEPTWV